MTAVGIAGASGYTGAELLRSCAQHPRFDVKVAAGESQAGSRAAALHPSGSALRHRRGRTRRRGAEGRSVG